MRILIRVKDDLSWQVLGEVARAFTRHPDTAAPDISLNTTDEPYTHSGPFAFLDPADAELYESLYVDRASATAQQADIVLACHPVGLSEHPNAVLACLHHGSGFGESAYALRVVQSSDLYFTVHDREHDYIGHYLRNGLGGRRLVTAGQPRLDRLIHWQEQVARNRRAVCEHLGLPPDKRVILLTSHWTPMALLRRFGGDLIRALAPLGRAYTLVQTAHPLLWRSPDYDTFNPRNPDWQAGTPFDADTLREDLAQACAQTPGAVLLPTPDPSRMLALADLVIGDYSSVLIEAALLDRPGLFTDRPERFMEKFRLELYRGAFTAFDGTTDVLIRAQGELAAPERNRAGRTALAQTMSVPPGRAADTIVETLLSLDVGRLKRDRGR